MPARCDRRAAPALKRSPKLSGISGSIAAFQSVHSATSRSARSRRRSRRLARSRGSSTTLNRNVLSRIFRYLKSPSRIARWRVGLVAPEQFARYADRAPRSAPAAADAVGRIAGVAAPRRPPPARSANQSMVIATCSLTRPAGMRAGQQISAGNAQPAFQQFGLDPGKRPGVGETLAAIVAGEDRRWCCPPDRARPAPARPGRSAGPSPATMRA